MQCKSFIAALALGAMSIPSGASAQDSSCNVNSDSIEIFAYANPDGAGGLHMVAKCCKSGEWKPVVPGSVVNSDFGSWGPGKRMFFPVIAFDGDSQQWAVVFNPDKEKTVVAYTVSPDLVSWMPQEYTSAANGNPMPASFTAGKPAKVKIGDKTFDGTTLKVPSALIKNYKSAVKARNIRGARNAETTAQDAERFAGLKPVNMSVRLQPFHSKPISDKLIGIFFEDINYAADGGLYAELVRNRDFEFSPADRGEWDSMTGWTFAGKGEYSSKIETANPIHANNPHYLTLDIARPGIALINSGFDGITVNKNEKYDLSMRVRTSSPSSLEVSLVSPAGKTLASKTLAVKGASDWQTVEATLLAKESCDSASLKITPKKKGSLSLDMISLFPENTFMGRKNGLRNDLATTLAELRPRFVRFPGGCVAHGNGVDNIYDWKGSIGPLEARTGKPNLWGYHQTRGLGYHEYFLFCEDIDAEPLPVLSAGVPCQNSSWKSHHSTDVLTSEGQQCGIPMEEMDAYIQDVLDLIEYANGSTDTRWGAERAKAGHPEPFNLKYIGIGNEDLITEAFKTRFLMIYDAVKKAHPEITVIGTVGPFYEGPDYEEGWRFAEEHNIPMVDEHYYVAPGWLINNQGYYDNYRRGGTKVYLGEYASHMEGRPSNLEAALSDAIYLTAVERNGDVVEMTSYAPLLSKKNRTQWTPDLIYFDNNNINLTPDYYVQKMYGNNSGDTYVPAIITLDNDRRDVNVRVGASSVIDPVTGDLIVKLVNLLPVEVNTNLESAGLAKSGKASVTLLTGKPADLDAAPVEGSIDFTGSYTMPPYSFTVLRFPKN